MQTTNTREHPPAAQRIAQHAVVDCLRAWLGGNGGEAHVSETHLSWLVFGRDDVFKVKKALADRVLGYATPAQRAARCRAEVVLNRRLAGRIYRGVVTVRRHPAAGLTLERHGEPVETVVRMRRLPAEACLTHALGRNTLAADSASAVAGRIAAFHAELAPAAPPLSPAILHRRIAADARAVAARRYGLDRGRVLRLGHAAARLARDRAPVLAERLRLGRVVDGHGDLRPEHVYLLPAPVVIDCLEFSRALRVRDVVDEMALLVMECERLGAETTGRQLRQAYVTAADEDPDDGLWALFMARRALLWARLALAHLDRDARRDRDRWVHRAYQYLALVARYTG